MKKLLLTDVIVAAALDPDLLSKLRISTRRHGKLIYIGITREVGLLGTYSYLQWETAVGSSLQIVLRSRDMESPTKALMSLILLLEQLLKT